MTTDIRSETFAYAMSEFLKQNYGKSIEQLDKVLEADPADKAALATRGVARMKLGHPDEAIRDFDRALAVDPAYGRAYHLRGLAKELKGDDDGALDDFTRAIEADPDYGAAYQSRSALYAKMGKEDFALQDIETVARLTNVNIETYANENNIWRSHQLRVEEMMESEMAR